MLHGTYSRNVIDIFLHVRTVRKLQLTCLTQVEKRTRIACTSARFIYLVIWIHRFKLAATYFYFLTIAIDAVINNLIYLTPINEQFLSIYISLEYHQPSTTRNISLLGSGLFWFRSDIQISYILNKASWVVCYSFPFVAFSYRFFLTTQHSVSGWYCYLLYILHPVSCLPLT